MGMKRKSVFTVRQIVVSGVLGAIAVLLGVTQLGFIPVPTAAGHATIMHVPAIIGGILEGWVVGGIIGLIFGISSFLNATIPLFKDPLVAILPRLFIGIVAYFVYRGMRRWNEPLAVGAAALMGSVTNTVLVLGMAVVRNYMSLGVAASVALLNGLPEAIVSVIITVAVVLAWKRVDRGTSKSRI